MYEEMLKNPFLLLKLPMDATQKEIIKQSEESMDIAEAEEERNTYRWAKEQLISNDSVRLRYELFEMPDTQYEDEELERFIRKYKKNPVNVKTLMQETPPISLQDFDISGLIRLLIEDLLAAPEANLNDILQHIPAYEIESPLEVNDVIFG